MPERRILVFKQIEQGTPSVTTSTAEFAIDSGDDVSLRISSPVVARETGRPVILCGKSIGT